VADFVTRRIGKEFLDYAINPLVGGIYAGDPARLSVTHAFPKLHALEQRYGSLILGQFLGARERKRRNEVAKQDAKKISFDEGLSVLTDALHRKLSSAIQLHCTVGHMRQMEDGWQLMVSRSEREEVAEHVAVIFAGPSYKLPDIEFGGAIEAKAGVLREIPYPPVASVVLGFRREDVGHPLDGFGVLIPEVEGFKILGAIFSSSIFPHRAPAGHVTLTCYVGGCRAPGLARLRPEEAKELAVGDLRALLNVKGEPTFYHHVAFARAIPQYEVGFGRFKAIMDDLETSTRGLFLAGHYRDGISLGDSILSGYNVASKVEAFWDSHHQSMRPTIHRPVTTVAA
jgi:oxygen-dependent protoporphyrinogen oxidase